MQDFGVAISVRHLWWDWSRFQKNLFELISEKQNVIFRSKGS